MADEIDSRGRRVLCDLNSAFKRDPEIDEYDFIPVFEAKHNRCPVLLTEHKLGIELWAVKVLYQYTYNSIMQWKANPRAGQELEPSDLTRLSRGALLVNPDCSTIWNIRKNLVKNQHLSVQEDLKLGTLIISKHPKSPETFAHRKWLLQRLLKPELRAVNGPACTQNAPKQQTANGRTGKEDCKYTTNSTPLSADTKDTVDNEWALCQLAAEKYSNNYNAWSHRIWVAQHVCQCHKQVLLSQLESTEAWLSKHVSDYSGFHYRQFLLDKLQPHLEHRVFWALLDKELALTSDLTLSFPGHQAIWCHRRYIVHATMAVSEKTTEPGLHADNEVQVMKRSKLEHHRDAILHTEQEFVSKVTENSGKQGYTWNVALAQNHQAWLLRQFSLPAETL